MRGIRQAYLFLLLGYEAIETLECGNEEFHIPFPFLIDIGAHPSHFLFQQGHQFVVGLFLLLEQGVALLQRLVVPNESIQIRMVILRDDDVQEVSALLAASCYEPLVGRGDHDERDEAYMVGYSPICLLASPEHFLLALFQTTVNGLMCAILVFVFPLDGHEFLSVHDGL